MALNLKDRYAEERSKYRDEDLTHHIVFRPEEVQGRYFTWMNTSKYGRIKGELYQSGLETLMSLTKEERCEKRKIAFVNYENDRQEEETYLFMNVHKGN